MPKGSATSVVIGLAAAVAAFGLIWEIWGLTIVALQVIVAAVVLRSFGRNQHRTIPAAEVAREHETWLTRVRATRAIPRQLETAAVNRGLAEMVA